MLREARWRTAVHDASRGVVVVAAYGPQEQGGGRVEAEPVLVRGRDDLTTAVFIGDDGQMPMRCP